MRSDLRPVVDRPRRSSSARSSATFIFFGSQGAILQIAGSVSDFSRFSRRPISLKRHVDHRRPRRLRSEATAGMNSIPDPDPSLEPVHSHGVKSRTPSARYRRGLGRCRSPIS